MRASIEAIVEEEGIVAAVRAVFTSASTLSPHEKAMRVAELEEACGVSLGDDEAQWLAWVEDLARRGVAGFGPVPEREDGAFQIGPQMVRAMADEGILSVPESTDQSRIPTGTTIGGFRIIDEIGKGGMGLVYKARQLSLDRIVALKILPKRFAHDESFVARFVRETKVAARLDHTGIVRGIDAGRDGDTYYFAMEYVEGGSVAALIKDEGRIPNDRALEIAIQVARAIDHAWGEGLVHRDIKPDNILLDKNGVAKLADLGLARSTAIDPLTMTRTGAAMGTPHYMSPEQARGERDVDVRTDIYSFGSTLYHMVTGRPPFAGTSAAVVLTKHLSEQPVPAHIRCQDVSANLGMIIVKMMQKDAKGRYQTPKELLEDLELAAGGLSPVHAGPPEQRTWARRLWLRTRMLFMERPAGPPAWRPRAMASGAMALIGLLPLVWFLNRGSPKQDTQRMSAAGSIDLETGRPATMSLGAEHIDSARSAIPSESMRNVSGPPDPVSVEAAGGPEATEEERTIAGSQGVESVLADAKRKAGARDWRGVWRLAGQALAKRGSDPRLEALARRAVIELAPPETVVGPLGVEFVLVSGGGFDMGSERGLPEEGPRHSVFVSSYYLGRLEVTREQFEAFGKRLRAATIGASEAGRMPVVSVTWREARAFCDFLAKCDPGVAYRLPTEAEWEYAARGRDSRAYPWGNDLPSNRHANLAGDGDGHGGLAPVGSLPDGATPEGIMDMIGNAAEWCLDRYGPYSAGPKRNPCEMEKGGKRILRGGSHAVDKRVWSRASMRVAADPGRRADHVGFRVVRELTREEHEFLRLSRATKGAP